MRMSKWSLILSMIVKYSHQSLIYAANDVTENDIMQERMSKILSSCQADEMNYIALCWSSKISEQWSFTTLRNTATIRLEFPVSNSNEIFHSRNIYYDNPLRYKKPQAFILFISSTSDLIRLIQKLMKSIWWDPLAFYAIIDTRISICNQAESYLSITWQSDLERSSFFCIDSDKTNAVYTFNRYGNPVPRSWQVVESSLLNNRTNRTWTMLKYKFQNDTTCEDLNFQKNIKANDYRMRLVGGLSPPTLTVNHQEKGTKTYGGLDGLILSTLFDKMNATMSVTMVDMNSKIYLLLQNVSANEYDMLMNSQYIFNKANYTMTYPHIDSGISLLTRPSGFDSNGIKILKFMNPYLIVGILAVFAVTVFILSVSVDQRTSSALLEVMRITTNVSILHVPRDTPLKIYLIIVILMFLITSSIFHGSLSALLTSPKRPNIDDMEALKAAGFSIYTYAGYKNAIYDSILRSRVRKTDRWDCSKYVIEYPNTACVADRNRITRIAFEKDLHVSKHRIMNLHMGYVTRPNFPFIKRIGTRLLSISQAGLTNHWREKTVFVYKNKWIMKEQAMKRKQYRVLNVSDLLFVFYILFAGLGVAIFAFLSESLSIMRWRKLRRD